MKKLLIFIALLMITTMSYAEVILVKSLFLMSHQIDLTGTYVDGLVRLMTILPLQVELVRLV